MLPHLPASEQRLEEYRKAQAADPTCSEVINYCHHGWPNGSSINANIKPYWNARGELTLHDSLLLYGSRIVVPKSLQRETMEKIHEGHQGIERCRLRARYAVWWPGMSRELEDFIRACPRCIRETTPPHEPLLSTQLPKYPWQRVASDFFTLNGADYLLVVDYFSRYPEIVKMRSTTSKATIEALKSIFARHGIPETLISDNGPQYSSKEFAEFAKSYDFCHVTSSPHFPQSNGMAERMVQTIKRLLKEAVDPFKAPSADLKGVLVCLGIP